jgi:hypothetical protein
MHAALTDRNFITPSTPLVRRGDDDSCPIRAVVRLNMRIQIARPG